ncbi:VOC family protein [Sinomonas sp. ASV486]|uniref:VOC family protein n=1 Tax=Sinomonas sp. ASV486 TaxID=3051170 RepID=UPI0027DDE4F2|nr:VOC family protein [Sinomonas sp. ASV486]MDQ4489790.1 VOC family protein [Sinomonas sp. ASV486]
MTSSANGSVSLHHVALYVSDLEKTRKFYTDVLGMEEIARPADFVFPGAYFRLGTAEVHVVVETENGRTAALAPDWSPEEVRTGYSVHFALKVDSLDDVRETLRRNGVAPVGGPRVRADDVEQIYVADPDGYFIEFICWLDHETAERRLKELADSGEGVPVAPGH